MKLSKIEIEFRNVSDLKPFGINPLTGEACAYGMRILCDVNRDGKELLEEFLGGVLVTASNWNSQVNGKDAIRSVMLSRGVFADLYKYICWREGCKYVVVYPKNYLVAGYMDLENHEVEHFRQDGYELYRNPTIKSQPQVNGRNVHAMTGRTE